MNTPVSFELDKLLLSKNIDMPVNPTISDVVMWIYETHKIWIGVSLSDSGLMFFYKIQTTLADYFDFNYIKPTDAYEAAITYTLNTLIDNVNSNLNRTYHHFY